MVTEKGNAQDRSRSIPTNYIGNQSLTSERRGNERDVLC